jgi:hypothetical protein
MFSLRYGVLVPMPTLPRK